MLLKPSYRPSRRRVVYIVGALAAGAIITSAFLLSHAASPIGFSASTGTVTSPASVISDGTATNGQAVKFGSGASGGATPHIMVFVMENESYSDIIGSSSAPYMNSLSHSYRTLTNSHAIAHNSLPNYLGIFTGTFYPWSAAGAANDDCSPGGSCLIPSGTTSLGDQLDTAGISWNAFMGGMPSNCYINDSGGSGGYVVHHNPFMYESSLVTRDCAKIQPSTNMITAMNSATPPSFVFYSPTICNDAGGDAGCSTISAGDSHVASMIPAIQATTWYQNGGVIMLTFDEGNDNTGQNGDFGGQVLTILISAKTAGAANITSYVDTFGLLHSIENVYGLACLVSACAATSGSLAL